MSSEECDIINYIKSVGFVEVENNNNIKKFSNNFDNYFNLEITFFDDVISEIKKVLILNSEYSENIISSFKISNKFDLISISKFNFILEDIFQ